MIFHILEFCSIEILKKVKLENRLAIAEHTTQPFLILCIEPIKQGFIKALNQVGNEALKCYDVSLDRLSHFFLLLVEFDEVHIRL